MSVRLSSFSRWSLIVGLTAVLAGGCAQSRGTPQRPQFTAKTEGTPAERWAHIAHLKRVYEQADVNDLEAVHANFIAYSEAVIETAASIVEDPEATDEMRRKAAQAELEALKDQVLESKPKALDRLRAVTEKMEQDWQGTELTSLAAFEWVKALEDAPESAFPSEEARFEQVSRAAIQLANDKSPHPETAQILGRLASEAELTGRETLAQKLYKVLAERFPDDPQAQYAAGIARRLALKGQVLSGFSGETYEGKTLNLEDYRGKVVVIDFWATWCGPCMQEMPSMKMMHEQLGPLGLQIIGVNLDEKREPVEEFLKTSKLDWPQIRSSAVPVSEDENAEQPLAVRFGVMAIPYLMVVDRDGQLVATGYHLRDLVALISDLVHESPDADEKTGTRGVSVK